jgi:threonyl-tRNA synthetase
MSNRKKMNIEYEKDNSDLYYYSSEDSEDELDRITRKSILNTIQSNFTQTFIDSPIK